MDVGPLETVNIPLVALRYRGFQALIRGPIKTLNQHLLTAEAASIACKANLCVNVHVR